MSEEFADGALVTIGFFDGIHRGHRFLLRRARETAMNMGLACVVVTFGLPARCVLDASFHPSMLLLPDEKLKMLNGLSGMKPVMMDFTHELLQLTAREFMILLKDRLHMRVLMVGYDHHFGNGRKETFEDYVRYGASMNVSVIRGEPYIPEGEDGPVSSSLIRSLLLEGRIEKANALLGYRYFLSGTVQKGDQIGRKLGYPTANLLLENNKLIPANGVYTCLARIDGMAQEMNGMLYIGDRPTLNGPSLRRAEIHLLDYSGQLYGGRLTVSMEGLIRKERKFQNLKELSEQLSRDEQSARVMLKP